MFLSYFYLSFMFSFFLRCVVFRAMLCPPPPCCGVRTHPPFFLPGPVPDAEADVHRAAGLCRRCGCHDSHHFLRVTAPPFPACPAWCTPLTALSSSNPACTLRPHSTPLPGRGFGVDQAGEAPVYRLPHRAQDLGRPHAPAVLYFFVLFLSLLLLVYFFCAFSFTELWDRVKIWI